MQIIPVNSQINLFNNHKRIKEQTESQAHNKPVFQGSMSNKNLLSLLTLAISSFTTEGFFAKDVQAIPADWKLEQAQNVDQRTDKEKTVTLVENGCTALLLRIISLTMTPLIKDVKPMVDEFTQPSSEDKEAFKLIVKELEKQEALMSKNNVTLLGIMKLKDGVPSEEQAKIFQSYVDTVLKGFKMVKKFKEVPQNLVSRFVGNSLSFIPDIVTSQDRLDAAIIRNNGEFKSCWGIDWDTFGGLLAEEDQ